MREHRNLKLYPNPALPVTMSLDIQGAKGTAKSEGWQRVDSNTIGYPADYVFPAVRHSSVALGYDLHRMIARACKDSDS